MGAVVVVVDDEVVGPVVVVVKVGRGTMRKVVVVRPSWVAAAARGTGEPAGVTMSSAASMSRAIAATAAVAARRG
ncbi:MAG: hypothetical protein GX536_05555 [Actinobacteria bacterium]|nr:hypothetical protein [Actinomycetota bacterium]